MADVLFTGLAMVTGERDTGKTSFALSCGAAPEKMALFDHDLKSSEVVQQLLKAKHPLKYYHNLVELRKSKTELPFFSACMDLVNNIKDGELDALIWDNYTPFEDTFHPVVMSDPNKWRSTWSSMGAIKGAQQWDASFTLGEQVLDVLKKKAKLVFIIYHLKNFNLGGVRTEKLVPAAKKVVPQKANFSVWLRVNEQGGGAPIGLILKRLAKYTIAESGGMEITNVLPRKMVPCTWDEIRKYWDMPFGEAKPEKNQLPNAFELSILDATFTPDQRKSFELMLQFGSQTEDEAGILADVDLAAQVKQYAAEHPGITPGEIKTALNLDISVPEIIKMSK